MIRFQTPQLPAVEQVAAYFARSEATRWYSNRGPCHELLVERLEGYLGGGVRCVPVANATLGLMVGLRALVPRGVSRREVLLPSFTFAATAEAALWAGLEPVFVDVDAESWHMDPAALHAALEVHGEGVAAILACSTFGVPPPLVQRKQWESAADSAGVPLLVDSAAGFGAIADDQRPLGWQGDAEVFSFHATKPFAIGEGGLVTTADAELAGRLERLVNFGFERGVVADQVGLNAKLPEWSAATGLAVLDEFDDVLARRRHAAERILAGVEPLGYRSQRGTRGATWQFVPVLAPSAQVRSRALETARERGIELRAYFGVPLHRMPAFALMPVSGRLDCTEEIAARILSLPMANDMSLEAEDAVVAGLAAAVS